MMARVTEEYVVRFTGLPDRIDVDGGLTLRRWTEDDIPELVAVVNANLEHLRPWMPWAQQPSTPESSGEFIRGSIEQFEDGTTFAYAICDRDGSVIGGTGFHARRGPGVLEIGYWVAADRSGQGVATAVSRALVEVGRDVPGCERIEIRCDDANLPSAAVPRKLGFTLVGVVDEEDPAMLTPNDSGKTQIWHLDL
jgi:RimJ/RimL family protein N-acetyltransferase